MGNKGKFGMKDFMHGMGRGGRRNLWKKSQPPPLVLPPFISILSFLNTNFPGLRDQFNNPVRNYTNFFPLNTCVKNYA